MNTVQVDISIAFASNSPRVASHGTPVVGDWIEDPMSTIVSKFRSRGVAKQDDLALTFLHDGENDELKLGFAELDRRARAIAAQLQELGAAGERALLLYAPGADYV